MGASKFISPPSFSEKLEKEEKFFDKNFYMSYSGLNKLLYSPSMFYTHYVLKERDDSYDQLMVEGNLIHCLLLDPKSFDDKFLLTPNETPSDAQRDVLDTLFMFYGVDDSKESLNDFQETLLEILKDKNLYQSMKVPTQLSKMINDVTEEYWEFQKKSEGKIIIDHETYDFAKSVVEKITTNPVVMETMGFFGDEMNGITSKNELGLSIAPEDTKYTFGFTGFIDNLVFDKQNKIIRINDLKKTGKIISNFAVTIEYFNYWAQAVMYKKLVEHCIMDNPEYKDYTTEFRFIVVDSQMQIAPIKVSEETMKTWTERFDKTLEEADYHFKQKNFELPYEFLINKELVI